MNTTNTAIGILCTAALVIVIAWQFCKRDKSIYVSDKWRKDNLNDIEADQARRDGVIHQR